MTRTPNVLNARAREPSNDTEGESYQDNTHGEIQKRDDEGGFLVSGEGGVVDRFGGGRGSEDGRNSLSSPVSRVLEGEVGFIGEIAIGGGFDAAGRVAARAPDDLAEPVREGYWLRRARPFDETALLNDCSAVESVAELLVGKGGCSSRVEGEDFLVDVDSLLDGVDDGWKGRCEIGEMPRDIAELVQRKLSQPHG